MEAFHWYLSGRKEGLKYLTQDIGMSNLEFDYRRYLSLEWHSNTGQCCQLSQRATFHHEVTMIISGRSVDEKSPLYMRTPKIDGNKLLQIRGRLGTHRKNICPMQQKPYAPGHT